MLGTQRLQYGQYGLHGHTVGHRHITKREGEREGDRRDIKRKRKRKRERGEQKTSPNVKMKSHPNRLNPLKC